MIKKYINVTALLILALIFLFLSCDITGEERALRATFQHSFGGSLNIEVILEDAAGFSLNGASIILVNPDRSSQILDYNSNSCRYESSVIAPVNGLYTVSANSRGLTKELVLAINVTILTDKPAISDISDSLGSSANLGNTLSCHSDILVSSNAVPGADRYRLYIYGSSNLAYSISSAIPVFTIPADTIAVGNYIAAIEAQTVLGDSLLQNSEFYSVSAAVSSNFVFLAG